MFMKGAKSEKEFLIFEKLSYADELDLSQYYIKFLRIQNLLYLKLFRFSYILDDVSFI